MSVLDIEAAVRSLLLADSAVSTLVGTRIFPDVAAQACARPFAVYQEISNLSDISEDGPGLQKSRIQIDAYADKRADALAVESAIFDVLCPRLQSGRVGFRRTVALDDGSRVEVHGVIPSVRRSGYEPETKLYRRGRDFMIAATAA